MSGVAVVRDLRLSPLVAFARLEPEQRLPEKNALRLGPIPVTLLVAPERLEEWTPSARNLQEAP